MNANDIEQIILDLPPEGAAEIIWDLLSDTAFKLDEAEAGLVYYRTRSKWIEGIMNKTKAEGKMEVNAAWDKYWGIKQANAQRRSASLM